MPSRDTLPYLPCRAEVVGDEAERARLWELADRVLKPYAAYRDRAARAGRTIPSCGSCRAERAESGAKRSRSW